MENKKILVTMLAFCVAVLLSAGHVNGEDWTLVTSSGNHHTVTHGNNLWVIVGDGGLVKTSSNGVTWTERTSGVTQNLRGVTYGNSLFVAVGYSGCIITSPNGINWTRRWQGITDRFRCVCYGNSLFVGVGDNGLIVTSPDGKSWTERYSGVTTRLYGVCYSDKLNLYVAVGYAGVILTSTDGYTWTSRKLPNSPSVYLFNVVYGADDNRFVAVSRLGYVYTSSYGTFWSKSPTGATDDHLYAVTYGDSKFKASGNLGVIITSYDGINWTLEEDDLTDEPLWGIAYDGSSQFVTVGQDVLGSRTSAVTINVTTTEDNVPGSLRAAITTANTNGEDDIINLPAGTYFLSGDAGDDDNIGGDLDIDTDHGITIVGEGAGTTLIDGGQVDRVFHIINGTVSISGVTIQNGKSPSDKDGGGIYNNGTLTLTYCEIINNSAGSSDDKHKGGDGGGIYNDLGTLTLTNCNVSNNITGDGYHRKPLPSIEEVSAGNGGGIYNKNILTLANCTISSNKTGDGGSGTLGADYLGGNGGDGGGIFNDEGCTATITNCTICSNSTGKGCPTDYSGVDGSGGGIYGTVNTKNTIIANNSANLFGNGPDCYGILNSMGYNLIKNTSDCIIDGILSGNITEVDPMLGPLADNGGPTKTHALLFGSPAIDAGNSTGISIDQRGYSRPVDIPGIDNVSDGADIGAFEFDPINISGSITTNGTGLSGVTLTFSHNDGTETGPMGEMNKRLVNVKIVPGSGK